MIVLGLDIGGANLKAADTRGQWCERPFPIWKTPERLAAELAALLAPWTNFDRIAVTMTAELADCYRTKGDGIRQIVAAVERVAGKVPVDVWSIGGGLISATEITSRIDAPVMSFAASNWHALATWLAREQPDVSGLLIDIGSTTTDLIPFAEGHVQACGRTDLERMQHGELVYTGIRRTPVCAVVQSIVLEGCACPVSSELFATTQDVYLLLEEIAADISNCDTANGGPATGDEAYDRMTRQLCCDRTELSWNQAIDIARQVAVQQEQQVLKALSQVLDRASHGGGIQTIVVSGSGRFLAQRVLDRESRVFGVPRVDILELLKPAAPEAACAYAVAQLAMQAAVENCSNERARPNHE